MVNQNRINQKKKKIAIYVRVSTDHQATDLQRSELLEFVERRGWHVFRIYEDFGISGTHGNRPALRELLRDSRSKKFDVVICWKMDRLFRSLKDLVVTLQEFSELGIEFIALKENIDLTTSSGRLLMQIIGAMGEFEASLIRERVLAGLANAKAKGKKLGRPRCIDVAKVHELRQQGFSLGQISKEVGCTRSAVSKSLRKAP